MKKLTIPMCPLPVDKAKIVSRKFFGIGQVLTKMFPKIKDDLKQAEIDLTPIEYMSIAVFSATFIFLISLLFFFFIGSGISNPLQGISFSLPFALIFFVLTLTYIKNYPRVLVNRRIKALEKNLLHALKHLYVQIKSGVPIFNALESVSSSNYGLVSKEFKEIVKRINLGTPTESALDNSANRTPSKYYRRVIWQLSNGIKAGSDIGDVISSMIENISVEQKIMIKKYGASLNPLTLMYLMFAIIIPSLGVTFLIVLSSFSGLAITESIFWGILVILVTFQFMFIGLVKSRRPNIL